MARAKNSLLPEIKLIEEEFVMPQMDKTRRIWALLPHDYHSNTSRRYPVLYLQDAQNLFDEKAPFGSWRIDQRLASLAREGKGDIMIIAIDHGGRERISEYSPYHHREFGKGQGRLYAQFIIETLKPFIDKTFRTLPDREHCGIGGSSMGGLISAYIGITQAEFFGKMMIFSPSFWYSDKIYFDAFNYHVTLPTKIYLYAGEHESKLMTQHMRRFKRAVEHRPIEDVLTAFRISISPEGEHREYYWGVEFEHAVKWLFFENEA